MKTKMCLVWLATLLCPANTRIFKVHLKNESFVINDRKSLPWLDNIYQKVNNGIFGEMKMGLGLLGLLGQLSLLGLRGHLSLLGLLGFLCIAVVLESLLL